MKECFFSLYVGLFWRFLIFDLINFNVNLSEYQMSFVNVREFCFSLYVCLFWNFFNLVVARVLYYYCYFNIVTV